MVLGMGNGMATLARATAIADLYGAAAYGTIAGVAGAMTTGARAAGPSPAVYAGALRLCRAAVDAVGARAVAAAWPSTPSAASRSTTGVDR